MRFKPIQGFVISLFVVQLFGCSVWNERFASVQVASVSTAVPVALERDQRLTRAVEYLIDGKELECRELLEQLVEDTARVGGTDEALFRLSLLYLRDEGTKGSARVQQLLSRLKKDFPQSVWTRQSAPLAVYLSEVKNLRDRQRELKSLRETNLSLSRDNKELRQSIERIKNLDMDLELKIKR